MKRWKNYCTISMGFTLLELFAIIIASGFIKEGQRIILPLYIRIFIVATLSNGVIAWAIASLNYHKYIKS